MEEIRSVLASVREAVSAHPVAALAISHAVTSSAFLCILADGAPVSYLKKKLFQAVMSAVPASIMDQEMAKLRTKIEASVIGHAMEGETSVPALPTRGWSKADVIAALDRYSGKDAAMWKSGKVSGGIYHGGDDLTEIMVEAYKRFALSNPLHPDVFPAVRKMESEVVSMVLRLFNAGETGCGTMTSGGTESILMAMRAYKVYGMKYRGVREPELVIPSTAHAAFDKACDYFGIKLVKVPVDAKTFRADVAAMKRAVNRNTIAVVVSAPSFPQGVVDPVEEMGAFALARGLPMHVDCCLGSFLIAYASRMGYPLPGFDFRVPGVTSISVDTHKFGFAPKGSSVVLYAEPKFRHAQYFVAPDWVGGIYASPTIAGSRAGALVAACWATMVYVGDDKYMMYMRDIMEAAKEVAAAIGDMEEIVLFGKPDLSVVSFGTRPSSKLSIYGINDEMGKRGWNLNTLQDPACVHICFTYANCHRAKEFVADLRASVAAVAAAPAGMYKEGSAAIYGMAASIPDKSLVAQVASMFLDTLYKTV